MSVRFAALSGAAIFALASPAFAQSPVAGTAASAQPAPVSELVKAVDIPYQQFTLKNGLRVIVSTDRKAPVVAVSVWYDVGSKHEPQGKTGFAHMFEHLMFNGSENNPGEFFEPLKQVGATDYNGTTYYDRTNYFETVPRAALERALFLESDRMGYLTGAITQGVLDEQRGVVQNEKRQNDNQPYGLLSYATTEGLFPPTHPYGHLTIGSMADLDKASLADVKGWFKSHYGPNNAVLVLAGDIDAAAARPLVEKYFGGIPTGPKSVSPAAPIVSLQQRKDVTIKDRVAATLITRNWVVPGVNDKDATALDVAAGVLGGMSSSRMKNILVRDEKLAVQVGVSNESFAQLGNFTIYVVARPGVDQAVVEKRVDEIVADFLKTGPTADEVKRYVTSSVSGTIAGYQSVGGFGGKAVALASGELYSNDPGFYKKQLAELAAETPATVKAAADKWLGRPTLAVAVVPGARDAYAESTPPVAVPTAAEPPVKGTRGALPPVGDVPALAFPQVTRTRLTNGIEVVYAQRTTVPLTLASISFDAGAAADVANKLGTGQMMLSMLDEGTTSRSSKQIAEDQERLGASITSGEQSDRSIIGVFTPSANLALSLGLLSDVVRNPAFAPAEVARVKNQQLAGIQQELTDPNGLANRVLPKIVFGSASPYSKEQGGGDPAAVASLTPADLQAFKAAWIRPDKAKIFVVSDRPLAEVTAALNTAFGDWQATGAAGTKSFPASAEAAAPAKRIVLVDRPDSPQSLIVGAEPNTLKGTDDMLPITVANDALGGSFLSRVNMDLREAKHWSYGVFGYFDRKEFAAPYQIQAPVQADKTGEAIKSLDADIAGYLGAQPMTQAEFDRAITGGVRSLAGNFETSGAVLNAMQQNDLYKRPDDYYATVTQRYKALTLPQVSTALKAAVEPAGFTWVVVGDAKVVQPQLANLGYKVEVMPAAAVVGGTPAPAPAAGGK